MQWEVIFNICLVVKFHNAVWRCFLFLWPFFISCLSGIFCPQTNLHMVARLDSITGDTHSLVFTYYMTHRCSSVIMILFWHSCAPGTPWGVEELYVGRIMDFGAKPLPLLPQEEILHPACMLLYSISYKQMLAWLELCPCTRSFSTQVFFTSTESAEWEKARGLTFQCLCF